LELTVKFVKIKGILENTEKLDCTRFFVKKTDESNSGIKKRVGILANPLFIKRFFVQA